MTRHAVNGTQHRARYSFVRCAVGSEAAVGDDGNPGCQFARLIGIVGREDDPEAALAQGAHAIEHQEAIAEIEARCRLVHHQERRILRQGARNQAELALAAGDAICFAVGKVEDAQLVERSACAIVVGGAGCCERSEMRRAAHQHQIEDGVGELHHLRLRNIGDGAGKRLA